MMPNTIHPVLLAVLAHPDDETFGMGGTLAEYSRRGVNVHLVCATRGEVGEVKPELLNGFASIADLREGELRCAAEVLGLKGVHFLDYRDSGMAGSQDNHHPRALAAASVDEVAGKVVTLIRKLKPQVVVTFDPIGGYRHPDHIAIHNATVKAFHLAGDTGFMDAEGLPAYQPQRLFFHTISRTFLRLAVFMIVLFGKNPAKFGANGDIDLLSIARVKFPVHARIDYSQVSAIRDQAAACHVSQGGAQIASGPQAWLRKLNAEKELFSQAYPVQNSRKISTDLFFGVDIN